MKLKLSPWSAILGLLLLLMVASILGLVPYLTATHIFWIAVTVACVWLIMRVFFSGK